MVAQRAGLPRPIAKRLRAKIRDRPETGRKPARATSHRVGNSLALTTAVQPGGIDLPRAAVEIASVIEACRPVRTQGPVAAHSAAAAAVRRVPAVPAAVPVWALGAAGAGDGGGKGTMSNEKRMRVQEKTIWAVTMLCLVPSVLALLVFIAFAFGQEAKSTQKTFATPEQAATALVQAAEKFDVSALKAILGPESEDLVSSEDPVRDKNIAAAFAAKAHERTSFSADSNNANRVVLLVGNDDFPLAIPIMHKNGTWFFDTNTGKQEMLYRRIGANELDAIQICRGYVEAQHEYAMTKHDGAEVNQYAQRVISSPGTHDGLVWRNSDGSLGGPIAENIADALQQGYTDKAKPYHGYFFKILKGQGPAAPLGKLDFVVEGAMIGGFALAAAPADYRVTGVKTFIVGYDGIVYQKDLGPDTLKVFKNMELYNPDKSWSSTEDSWPPDALDASTSVAQE